MNKILPFLGVIAVIREGSPREYAKSLGIVQQRAHAAEHRLDSIYYHLNRMMDGIVMNIRIPSILTLRSKDLFGDVNLTLDQQLQFWSNLPKRLMTLLHDEKSRIYVDWDLSLVRFCMKQCNEPPIPWSKLACSTHDFQGMSVHPKEMLKHVEDTPCQAFLKVVPTATCDADCDTVMALNDDRIDSRPLIAFPMGEFGKRARVECLSRGLAGTYGYVKDRSPAAPGQIPFEELMEMPEVRQIYH